jgi:hypothetical protein
MLGFKDFWVGLIYILTIASGLACIVYGILNWNKGNDSVNSEDQQWAKEEKLIEKELD